MGDKTPVVVTDAMLTKGVRAATILSAEGAPADVVALYVFVAMVREWLGEETVFLLGEDEDTAAQFVERKRQ